MVKLNGAGEADTSPPGGPAFGAQLDNENTSFAAVNPTNGEVFFDNFTFIAILALPVSPGPLDGLEHLSALESN